MSIFTDLRQIATDDLDKRRLTSRGRLPPQHPWPAVLSIGQKADQIIEDLQDRTKDFCVAFVQKIRGEYAQSSSYDVMLEIKLRLPFAPFMDLSIKIPDNTGETIWLSAVDGYSWDAKGKFFRAYVADDETVYDYIRDAQNKHGTVVSLEGKRREMRKALENYDMSIWTVVDQGLLDTQWDGRVF